MICIQLTRTDFLDAHPGGPSVILRCAGKDATGDFDSVHDKEVLSDLPSSALRGQVEPGTLPSPKPKEQQTQPGDSSIAPPLRSLINLQDFEEIAKRSLPPNAWAYYSSGADDEISKRQNQRAYQKIYLRPRILRSIPSVDTSTTILGHATSLPVYMSPVGIAKLAHPEGERALASAAGKEGLIQVLANGASTSIERVMEARARSDQPVFFQLYVNRDMKKSEDMVRRAQKAGASAIWVTVDSPVVGKREMDERLNLQVQV